MKHQYTLKRSNRKTMSLTVKPDCTVVVSAPIKTSPKAIDEFVASHSNWIDKHIEKFKAYSKQNETLCVDYGGEIYFFGEKVIIKPANVRKPIYYENAILIPTGLNSEQIKDRIVVFCRETLRSYIEERLPELSQKIGVSPAKLTISSAKTNWGSCTADRVHFSRHLIVADKQVIDYVIIHELTHIIHHNHSNAFWNEVARHCPQYKQLRAKLKEYARYVDPT